MWSKRTIDSAACKIYIFTEFANIMWGYFHVISIHLLLFQHIFRYPSILHDCFKLLIPITYSYFRSLLTMLMTLMGFWFWGEKLAASWVITRDVLSGKPAKIQKKKPVLSKFSRYVGAIWFIFPCSPKIGSNFLSFRCNYLLQ